MSRSEYADNLIDEDIEPDAEDFAENEGQDGEAGGTEDPDQHMQNVVTTGDPSGAAGRASTNVKGLKEKRVPNEKRTTTPYMTKYERARVLGTRALQIRYGLIPQFSRTKTTMGGEDADVLCVQHERASFG